MFRLLPAIALLLAPLTAQQLSPLDAPATHAGTAQAPTNALDKKDLEFYVRHLFVYGPQIHIEVGEYVESGVPGLLQTTVTASFRLQSKSHTFFVSKDGKHLVEGSTYQIDQNPFQDALKTMDTTKAPAFGEEGASVVVVAYSDFQCPFCAQEALILRNQLKNEYSGKVRVYFRDFPLSNHDWAQEAAVAGRCIYNQEPEAFWAYHDWIFANQGAVTKANLRDKIAAQAKTYGVDALKLSGCMSDPAAAAEVEASLGEGRAVGVTSTPTLFVNGRKLAGSVKWEQLKAVIDYELEYQQITHNAGDDCGCSVDLDFPK
jgi:protein-disulfide isomerase